ncbi:helix-turn-helix domain-containing protein [Paenibacillus sp. IB182496]|uniref:Helix-turn-helix domain-containing protein n=1 Tax=Paenibacillus sabuli TaxID=2772509 RepID=A0A927BQY1_9BACL|nr:helix-turn-helix domain-containing protein [Paenibacillus sabuli]MBD2845111.1 helix-turn-helix domain-containing protein [Paenibacillus sabuli]
MAEAPYRLLIVDDDREVREGLVQIVDWGRVGFRVADALADGREGIAYLDRQEVEVVLSDIRMNFVSGLELAKHVHERALPVKVVLISGYQEFGLAKEALRYGVKDYLLKPTDLDEVYDVFAAIRQQLDQERSEVRRRARDKQRWQQTMDDLKLYYLPHVLHAAQLESEEIRRQFETIGVSLDPDSACCSRIAVEWDGPQPPEAVLRALQRSAADDDESLTLLPCGELTQPLRLLAVSAGSSQAQLEAALRDRIAHATSKLQGVFGLTLRSRLEEAHESLVHYLRRRQAEQAADRGEPQGAADEAITRWARDKRQWLADVGAGHLAPARRLLRDIAEFDQTGASASALRSKLIELFGSVEAVAEADRISDGLLRLCRSEAPAELLEIGLQLLDQLETADAPVESAERERSVITQVKRFIQERGGVDVSLSDAADLVYLSPVYLSRLFKRETGRSFSDYVTEIRLEQAARLLRETNLKIYAISEQTGYRDVRHFYKLFKSYAGCSPSEYRERRAR